jgi:hypothetical protein
MKERGVQVDHSNIYRWVQKFMPHLEAALWTKPISRSKVSGSACIGLSTERVRLIDFLMRRL